jgi:hypothetical protein
VTGDLYNTANPFVTTGSRASKKSSVDLNAAAKQFVPGAASVNGGQNGYSQDETGVPVIVNGTNYNGNGQVPSYLAQPLSKRTSPTVVSPHTAPSKPTPVVTRYLKVQNMATQELLMAELERIRQTVSHRSVQSFSCLRHMLTVLTGRLEVPCRD